ncbi:MAG: imidazole glycerol phosphate synthase subunit HisH [Nitrospirae bacterium]|nr:imidazole glycerol phosphate synthase subunit HisH [Nitrospirota bacterium]
MSLSSFITNIFLCVLDYGMGNLRSVEKGFLKVGVNARVTDRPDVIEKADGIVLPGVGAFRDCMRELTNLDLTDAIVNAVKKGKPYLGICLGLQVLFSESEEFGRCRGLDIFRGKVVKFDFTSSLCPPLSMGELKGGVSNTPSTNQPPTPSHQPLKIPHMGWNEISIKNNNPLLAGISDRTYFYFVHSYYVVPEDSAVTAATTDYGTAFTSMIYRGNVFATQFHPEKSQDAGLKILENFGRIVDSFVRGR